MRRPSSRLALFLTLCTFVMAAGAAFGADRVFSPVQRGFVEQAAAVPEYAPGRVLVKLTPQAARLAVRVQSAAPGERIVAETGVAELDATLRSVGMQRMTRSYQPKGNRDLAHRLGVDRQLIFEGGPNVDAMEAARTLSASPHVESATVDWRAFPAAVPNDPMYPDQWGHNNTSQMLSYDWATHSHENGSPVGTVGFDSNAEIAWDSGYGDTGVVIAILDSGVDAGHPDLRQVAGYDFGDNDSNPDDDSASPGHGTACAGVAAGIAQNNLGVSGIAGGCSIMPVKVADSAGSMYFSAIQDGLYWAADNGADVISMSLGANLSSDPATDAAIQYAHDAGVVILAATGNENTSFISYPAIHDLVIGVGAASPCGERKRSSSSRLEVNPGVETDPNGYTCDGERWWGSNYGSTTQDDRGAVDIIAPTIMPTTDISGSGGYAAGDYDMWFNGTSCSTPYAAGVCALIISGSPGLTPVQVRDQLVSTAQDVTSVESGVGWDRYTGYGMVDAAAAVGGGGPVAPVAAFSGSPLSGEVSLTVGFTDESTGVPTSWSWDFGDGGTSTAQNPSHTYTVAGTYTVSLTVSNDAGSDTLTKTDYVSVTEPAPPVAAFSGSPTSGAVPLDVSFADESTGAPTSWSWDFGDGGTSTAQNPSYTYAAIGTYTVSLTVSNANGSDSITRVDYITVTDAPAVIVSTALADLPSLGSVSGSYVDTWSADGTSETITETISDNHPRKTTSWLEHAWRFDVTGGSSVDFLLRASGGSSEGDAFVFEWSTDQATWNSLVSVTSSSMQDYTVTMPSSTSGTVYVRVTDSDRSWGNNALDSVSVDYLAFETGGGTPQPPTADFVGSPTNGSYPLDVSFTDQSSGSPTSWSWNFGDGGTSTVQNPTHTYAATGNYTVSLTATNAQGSDTATKVDYITVTEPGTGGDTMHVASLVVTRKTAGPNASGIATVTIEDAAGAAVANATVTLSATGPVGGTYTGLTDASGSATVETGKTKNASGEWCFEVTDVTHASLTYDPAANLVTQACESGTVFSAGAERTLTGITSQPNPFNPATEIRFGLERAGQVRLEVLDVRGRRVATLVDEVRSAGNHVVPWRPSTLASGVYYARLITSEGSQVHRLLLLK